MQTHLERLRGAADVDGPSSDFRAQLNELMEAVGLRDHHICEHFAVSLPSVQRWRNGRATPTPGMQQFVLSGLQRLRTPSAALAA